MTDSTDSELVATLRTKLEKQGTYSYELRPIEPATLREAYKSISVRTSSRNGYAHGRRQWTVTGLRKRLEEVRAFALGDRKLRKDPEAHVESERQRLLNDGRKSYVTEMVWVKLAMAGYHQNRIKE